MRDFRFAADHIAVYDRLVPATRSSGSSMRGEQPFRRGNRRPKRAFFLSSFVAVGDLASGAGLLGGLWQPSGSNFVKRN
ncbi:transposase [Streptomyces sp. NPDC013457]|uniref:transposase n=1 Tax=Streptomyces sp. NPDC013457 TaxID=3364866 RepID=UPI0036FDE33C